jgi:hypothetical protein
VPAPATSTSSEATEVDNLICCLEFLANEARAAGLADIQATIRRCIQEITRTQKASSGRKPAPPCSDILQVFKVIARFCLIGDPELKQQIVRQIEAIDREALAAHAH